MIMIAAEGGGIRAAYWTVKGLAAIDTGSGGCGARSTLFSGGASGGSVGLTAAVSTLLAEHQISCNVIAGYHHDHLLVPERKARTALQLLADLAASAKA